MTKAQVKEKKAIEAFLEAFWHDPDGVMEGMTRKSGQLHREAVQECAERLGLAAMVESGTESGMVDLDCMSVNLFTAAFVLGREFERRQAMEDSFK